VSAVPTTRAIRRLRTCRPEAIPLTQRITGSKQMLSSNEGPAQESINNLRSSVRHGPLNHTDGSVRWVPRSAQSPAGYFEKLALLHCGSFSPRPPAHHVHVE
jgi:hypothetical protein